MTKYREIITKRIPYNPYKLYYLIIQKFDKLYKKSKGELP